jgi:hypothetical protein
MMKSFRRAGVAFGLALLSACSGEPTQASADRIAAPAGAPNADLLGTLTGLVSKTLNLVAGVQRTQALPAPITVTQTIGSAGGTLSIPAAGVTVTIPKGALSAPTVITMTARAGKMVAYDFSPHGVTFAKPLVFTQKLSGTTAGVLSIPFLKLGYYADPSLLGTVTALVSELLDGSVDLKNWTFTSNIRHFSGYVMSCGRGEE